MYLSHHLTLQLRTLASNDEGYHSPLDPMREGKHIKGDRG